MPRDRLEAVDDVIARVRANMRKDYSVVHRFTFASITDAASPILVEVVLRLPNYVRPVFFSA